MYPRFARYFSNMLQFRLFLIYLFIFNSDPQWNGFTGMPVEHQYTSMLILFKLVHPDHYTPRKRAHTDHWHIDTNQLTIYSQMMPILHEGQSQYIKIMMLTRRSQFNVECVSVSLSDNSNSTEIIKFEMIISILGLPVRRSKTDL